jgi:hypothetical protein
VTLAELYIAADRAGIDPKPYFREAAGRASRKTPRGSLGESMAAMLRTLDGYYILDRRRQSR